MQETEEALELWIETEYPIPKVERPIEDWP